MAAEHRLQPYLAATTKMIAILWKHYQLQQKARVLDHDIGTGKSQGKAGPQRCRFELTRRGPERKFPPKLGSTVRRGRGARNRAVHSARRLEILWSAGLPAAPQADAHACGQGSAVCGRFAGWEFPSNLESFTILKTSLAWVKSGSICMCRNRQVLCLYDGKDAPLRKVQAQAAYHEGGVPRRCRSTPVQHRYGHPLWRQDWHIFVH